MICIYIYIYITSRVPKTLFNSRMLNSAEAEIHLWQVPCQVLWWENLRKWAVGKFWCDLVSQRSCACVLWIFIYIYMYIHILITIYNIYIYDMYMIQSPYKWGHSFSIIHAARAKARLMALCCHDGGFLRKVTDPLMDEYMICLCRYWSTHIYIYIYMQGPPQGLPSKSF